MFSSSKKIFIRRKFCLQDINKWDDDDNKGMHLIGKCLAEKGSFTAKTSRMCFADANAVIFLHTLYNGEYSP